MQRRDFLKIAFFTPFALHANAKEILEKKGAEKKELETLETEISRLEEEKSKIESALSSGILAPGELTGKSERFALLLIEIGLKSDRWLELSEKEQG